MRIVHAPFFLLVALGASGCAAEQDLGVRPGATEVGSRWSGSARGTVGGAPFLPTSALAHAGRGYVDGELDQPALTLIFSSAPDVCATTRFDQYVPGETYVQFHDVRAAIGTHTSRDAELFVVHPTCPSGTELGESRFAGSSIVGAGAQVTITRLDAERVEGTISAQFQDLSTFEGTFSVIPCAGGGDTGFGNDPICM